MKKRIAGASPDEDRPEREIELALGSAFFILSRPASAAQHAFIVVTTVARYGGRG